MKKPTLVISLGGSLIVPDQINVAFLREFKSVIEDFSHEYKFILIAGGGKTARNYIQAASQISQLTKDDLDWIGIHSTRLNAQLLRDIFRKQANRIVVKNPERAQPFKEDILVAAGWRPGNSTDLVAVKLAEKFKIDTVINLSNIDYVYTADPGKDPKAKAMPLMKWVDFCKLVGSKWDPGLSAPFDPVASKLAHKLGLRVVIMNGNPLANLRHFLGHKAFVGTVIE
ncbi:MAG: UMP kinase [Patescibacteria group bacterium]